MDKNRTFVGKVNGKTYDNVEDYNKAFLDAIGKDGMVTASIEFKPKDKPEDNVQGKQEHVYDHCLPDFDLDELTGVAETDTPIIEDFIEQDLSSKRSEDILVQAALMTTAARAELVADVEDMVESIQTDIKDNIRARTILRKDMTRNEHEIDEIRAKLDKLEKSKNKIQTQINITEGAGKVLQNELDFYEILQKRLTNKQRPSENKTVAHVTGRTTEKGNPGFILDHDQKEVARKLFQEIFGV